MPFSTVVMAMLTQSVGVPSTAKMRSEIVSSRSGRRSVSAWPMALASCKRRDDGHFAKRLSASASALMPSERTPSSLVTRIRLIISIRIIASVRRFGGSETLGSGTNEKRRIAARMRQRRRPMQTQRMRRTCSKETEHARSRRARRCSGDAVVDTERGALLRRRREVGDERTLGAFHAPVVHAVDHEPRDERGQRRAEGEADVDERVDDPAARDQLPSAEPIGGDAADAATTPSSRRAAAPTTAG